MHRTVKSRRRSPCFLAFPDRRRNGKPLAAAGRRRVAGNDVWFTCGHGIEADPALRFDLPDSRNWVMEALSPRGLMFRNIIFTGYNKHSYINTGLLYRGHSRGVKSKTKGSFRRDAAPEPGGLPRSIWPLAVRGGRQKREAGAAGDRAEGRPLRRRMDGNTRERYQSSRASGEPCQVAFP